MRRIYPEVSAHCVLGACYAETWNNYRMASIQKRLNDCGHNHITKPSFSGGDSLESIHLTYTTG